MIISILILVFLPVLFPISIINILTLILINIALATSWNLIGGYAGQLSFGHAIFFGIGAYTTIILFLRYNLTPWVGILIGGGIASSISIIIGLICFRLKGPFFTFATLAFAEILRLLALTFFDSITNGPRGLSLPVNVQHPFLSIIFPSSIHYYYLFLFWAFIILFLISFVVRSRRGLFLKAIGNEEMASMASGLNPLKYKTEAFFISAALASITGSFYGLYVGYIDPSSVLSIDVSLQPIVMSLLGGIGTFYGPLIGASVFTSLTKILEVYTHEIPGLQFILEGIILIATIMIFPKGIVGLFSMKRDREK
jgi:branched-chain amino acid transport system permease protein